MPAARRHSHFSSSSQPPSTSLLSRHISVVRETVIPSIFRWRFQRRSEVADSLRRVGLRHSQRSCCMDAPAWAWKNPLSRLTSPVPKLPESWPRPWDATVCQISHSGSLGSRRCLPRLNWRYWRTAVRRSSLVNLRVDGRRSAPCYSRAVKTESPRPPGRARNGERTIVTRWTRCSHMASGARFMTSPGAARKCPHIPLFRNHGVRDLVSQYKVQAGRRAPPRKGRRVDGEECPPVPVVFGKEEWKLDTLGDLYETLLPQHVSRTRLPLSSDDEERLHRVDRA